MIHLLSFVAGTRKDRWIDLEWRLRLRVRASHAEEDNGGCGCGCERACVPHTLTVTPQAKGSCSLLCGPVLLAFEYIRGKQAFCCAFLHRHYYVGQRRHRARQETLRSSILEANARFAARRLASTLLCGTTHVREK